MISDSIDDLSTGSHGNKCILLSRATSDIIMSQ